MTLTENSPLSIAEAARVTGVSAHALRYYEGQGLLDVPRTDAGRRAYGPRELSAVRFITQLRRTGMPIATIRQYADMVRAGTNSTGAGLRLLEEHRDVLEANLQVQQEFLRSITAKIDLYRGQLPEGG
ncbi:MerR family transcriptional regulator [Paenarthrobacter nitroguajacolicus]|uniref:MerR family transcriptional regulator n=1 Tax=Paenarthrobacter nitroguajacolicus TaxID=211146 RepID=UPI00248C5FE6|nr:MerR family transcriptional regulator [Paenarthrobacter nitroguajacolicus]MDI2035732.1 HTH-type transcriptional regulator AdhR [Paenarthrobacter nitroguajacolicus]